MAQADPQYNSNQSISRIKSLTAEEYAKADEDIKAEVRAEHGKRKAEIINLRKLSSQALDDDETCERTPEEYVW